jgi:hypothetical protein
MLADAACAGPLAEPHRLKWLRKKFLFVIPSEARDLLFFAKREKKTDSSGKPSPSE